MTTTDLIDGEHAGAAFEGDDIAAGTLSGVFEDCAFTACVLRETRLTDCRLVDCTFERCDLSAVRLDGCRIQGVRFVGCKLIGVDFSAAATVRLLRFEDCVLDEAAFCALELKELVLRRCRARGTDFLEAKVVEADFRGTDFEGARFHGTDLKGADFRETTNYAIDARANALRGARFDLPEAVSLLRSLDVRIDES